MIKKIHIADGYDRLVEEDADGTLHDVTPKAKPAKKVVLTAEDEAAIDKAARQGKTSSNVWI